MGKGSSLGELRRVGADVNEQTFGTPTLGRPASEWIFIFAMPNAVREYLSSEQQAMLLLCSRSHAWPLLRLLASSTAIRGTVFSARVDLFLVAIRGLG